MIFVKFTLSKVIMFTHDQQFVTTALNRIIEQTHQNLAADPAMFIIESDNAVQYKYTEHFHEIQKISNKYDKPIIRVYGIPQHGKVEVDHVGGIAKNCIRKAIAEGHFFRNVNEMTNYLKDKFNNHAHPIYIVDEIKSSDLDRPRQAASKTIYSPITGARSFQVDVFRPNCATIKTAPRLCMYRRIRIL